VGHALAVGADRKPFTVGVAFGAAGSRHLVLHKLSIDVVLYVVKQKVLLFTFLVCYTFGMLNIASMRKKTVTGLDADEILELYTRGTANKKSMNFRLSDEARRILDLGMERYKTDRTKALEIILREIREIWKRDGH
jgi:hypothetical protein